LSAIENELQAVLEWLFAAEPPPAIEARARELALDTLGCVIAASAHPEARAFAASLASSDPGRVRVPGFRESFSAGSAAAAFAAAACWDEACEGLARAHGRPGVPVLAAVAALAQGRDARLRDVLLALVAGYEVGGRLGAVLRIGPGMHVDGTWPALGVAASAVRLLGGSARDALAAVRIAACQMPYSLYLPILQGAQARNTYLGHSAQLGLLAASAALGGVKAPQGALDELRARALERAPAGARLAGSGEWLLAEGYLKPFAAVRHVHYGAAAALALRPRLAGRLERISRIALLTYAEALAYCANRAPRTPIQAQFSLSYGLARALAHGELDPSAYSGAALDDPLTRGLEAKVELAEDVAMTREGRRGAVLQIDCAGERLSQAVERVAGDPSCPMTRAEIVVKFARYANCDEAHARAFLEAPAELRWGTLVERLAAPAS
jgi:2-methylcitrate dehydratase PrpD